MFPRTFQARHPRKLIDIVLQEVWTTSRYSPKPWQTRQKGRSEWCCISCVSIEDQAQAQAGEQVILPRDIFLFLTILDSNAWAQTLAPFSD